MKIKLLIMALTLVSSVASYAQQKLEANKEKTKLQWLGEKVIGQHTGTVNLKSGWLNWQENKIVSGEFLIDMASIKTDEGNQRLEGHLKSDDFFGVDNYPVSRITIYESSPFDKGKGNVKGNITIKGVTKSIEFKATVQNTEEGTWFFANIVIDRSKFNIRYGSGSFFNDLGDKTIYDEFKIKVNLFIEKS